MVFTFPERHNCLLHGNLPEFHSVTWLDLPEKRNVCADHGGYFPVPACDGLHKKDDGLAVSGDLNRTRDNAFGDNGISQVLFPVKGWPGESNSGSVGL